MEDRLALSYAIYSQMKLLLQDFGYPSENHNTYRTAHGNVSGRTILTSGTEAELEQKAKKTRGPTAYWSTGLPYITSSKF